MLSCALTVALTLSADALGLEEPAAEPVATEAPKPKSGAAFRIAVDAGLPAGLALSLQFEPDPSVRFTLGALTNVMGFGVRGGLELLVVARWPLHPIIVAEAGHHFPGETRRLFQTGPEHISYTFVSGLLGLEARFGAITLHAVAGASGVWARTSQTTLFSRVQLDSLAIDGIVFAARLGLAVRLF